MKKYWVKYRNCIIQNIQNEPSELNGIRFWRNILLAESLIYLFPFCLIALIPGIYLSYKTGLYILIAVDMVVVFSIATIAFVPAIPLKYRKLIFLGCPYLLSTVLLYFLGLNGPGLIYLYAACIFGLFLLERKYAYWLAILNTFICIVFAIAIYFNTMPWLPSSGNEWVAVSTNTIFLSFISAALIPPLFTGLEQTIKKQFLLTQQLSVQQKALKASNHLIQQKNEELEQFAYIASHDLQEPLRMITSFLQQLEKKYKHTLDEKAQQYIYFANDGAKRMSRNINDLLKYSRAGRTDYSKELINLEALIYEYKSLRLKLIAEKSANIKFHSLPLINSFKVPISQVFHNLLDNALKYAKNNTPAEVIIESVENENYWEFAIKDNGIGIEEIYFEKIFTVFQRLKDVEDDSGSGIGLSIVKKIIDTLGGEIWVISEPAIGSTFNFRIPK